MDLLDYENMKKACRLCLKPDGIKLPIFGEVGVQRDVAHKINICFALAIYETDPLSKLICHRCLYKLEQNYEFRCEVLSAFQHLKKAMSLRRSDPVIDHYLSMVEDEVIVIGRSETCQPDTEHVSELMNETVNNNTMQPYGECTTFSGQSPRDQGEPEELIEHIPFDEGPSVDVCDVASEVLTRNSSSEGYDVFRHHENEIPCINSEIKTRAYCGNIIEANKQEVVPNGPVGSQNVMETLFRPQTGAKSGKTEKHTGLMKERAAPLAGNVDLQWCNFCQKYLKTKKLFRQHNVKVHNAVRSAVYKCKCKKRFHSLFEMLTHQETHLKVNINITEDMLLKCSLCDKKFADNSILKSHSATHSDKFNRTHLFKPCTNELGQKEKRIMIVTASPSELFVCEHCRQIFETASSLSQHLNSKHCFSLCGCVSGEKNISENSSVHQVKEIMQIAVENISLETRQVSSNVSDSMDLPSNNIASKTSLKSSTVHSITHLPDNTKNEINERTSADHNQSLFSSTVNQCSLCPKVYSSKKLLKKRNKTNIASGATDLSCTFCNRKFVKRSGLISHLHKHSCGESYHCKYCTKIYSNKEIFLSHKCLTYREYPFCNLQFSHYVEECASQPHQNGRGYLNLLDYNDLPKARQINVSGNNQAGSLGQSEEPERKYAHCVQSPKKSKNYNQNNNRKHIKRSSNECNRASHISRNENCVKCPFCYHLVKPESMYRHIYKNHPDSDNVT